MTDRNPFATGNNLGALTDTDKVVTERGGVAGHVFASDVTVKVAGTLVLNDPGAVTPSTAFTGTLRSGPDGGGRPNRPIVMFVQPWPYVSEDLWRSVDYGVTDQNGAFSITPPFGNLNLTTGDQAAIAMTMGGGTPQRSNVLHLVAGGVAPTVETPQAASVGAGLTNGTLVIDLSTTNTPIPTAVTWTVQSGTFTGFGLDSSTGAITITNSGSVTVGSSPRTLVVRATNTAGFAETTLTITIFATGNQPWPSATPRLAMGTYTFQGGTPGATDRSETENFYGYVEPYALDYSSFGSGTTLSNLVSSVAGFNGTGGGISGAWKGKNKTVVLGIGTAGKTQLSAIGTGAYDTAFTQIATRLVADGNTTWVIRPWWEFNGGWFDWSVNGSAGFTGTDFVNAWRRMHDVMMAVPGAKFLWFYNPNNTQLNINPYPSGGGAPYPGDAYVDWIGPDAYFQNYYANNKTVDQIFNNEWLGYLQGSFRNDSEQQAVAQAWNFCKAHNKIFALGETGVGFRPDGAANDSYRHVELMYNWLVANTNCEFLGWWNVPASDYHGRWTKTSLYTGTDTGVFNDEQKYGMARAQRHFYGNIGLKGELSSTGYETVAPSASLTQTDAVAPTGITGTGTSADPFVVTAYTATSGELITTLSSALGTRVRFRRFGTQDSRKNVGQTNAQNSFSISFTAGTIRTTQTPQRYLPKTSIDFGARNDIGGSNKTLYFSITATAPTLAPTATFNFDDHVATGTVVATFVPTNNPSPAGNNASDNKPMDGSTTINFWSVGGADAAGFSIDAKTGKLIIADSNYFDHGVRTSVSFTVTCDNSAYTGGGTATTTCSGTIYNVGQTAPPINVSVPTISGLASVTARLQRSGSDIAMDNSAWVKTNMLVTANVSGTADRVGLDGSFTNHRLTQTLTAQMFSGQQYVTEAIVQRDTASTASDYFQMYGPYGLSWCDFKIANGLGTGDAGSRGGIFAVNDWGNGKSRCRLTEVANATGLRSTYISAAPDQYNYPNKTVGGTSSILVHLFEIWGPGTLASTQGTWTQASGAVTYLYQWQQSPNGSTGWVNISGETNPNIVMASAYYQQYLRCQVTPQTSDGAGGFLTGTTASSAATQIAGIIPYPKTLPSLSTQSPTNGGTISVTDIDGNYYAYPTTINSRTYQWVNVTGTGASEVEANAGGTGATTATYTPNAGDVGKRLKCIVTATNDVGAATRTNKTLATTNAVV